MNKARIIVVEDENIVARDLAMSLEDMGYEVTSVTGRGEEAVRRSGEERPDLVLMDIVLSGKMDGIEAADLIRTRLGIPVIYLSAHSDPMTLERAKLTEPSGYLIKPFS